MDKLHAITVFCRVVESQSFTQAAAAQNISVAMASKLVSQLEEHLKTRLLQRNTRKTTATEAGMIYYQRCQPILMELQEADASISNLATTLQGNLVVSVPMDFGLRFITPNLPVFVNAHPHLHIEIEYSDRIVDLVAEGYDLALRIGYLQDSSLVARRIASSSLHFAASPEYLAKYGIPQTPDDLQQHDCLLYKAVGSAVLWELEKENRIQRLKVRSKLISNNGLTLAKLATSGLGIVNLPKFLMDEELRTGKLIEVLPDYKQKQLDLNIVYPHRRHLAAKVRAFAEFLAGLSL